MKAPHATLWVIILRFCLLCNGFAFNDDAVQLEDDEWAETPDGESLHPERYNSSRLIRVATYNMRNFEDNWEHRFHGIVSLLIQNAVDVVGFQELRKNRSNDQVAMLNKLLHNFQMIYMRGMSYDDGVEEGVALASSLPLRNVQRTPLPALRDSKDLNRRASVRGEVQVEPGVWIEVVASHLSYAKTQRYPQVQYLAGWADKQFGDMALRSHLAAQVLVADWNFYQEENADEVYLTRAGFHDAWLQANPAVPPAQSYTFSTWKPHDRPDRIYIRGAGRCRVDAKQVKRIGVDMTTLKDKDAPQSGYLSDHMGLVATLQIGC